MKQKLDRFVSSVLAFAMALSLVMVSPLTGMTEARAADAAAEGWYDTFTFYFYNDTAEKLYLDIWNHAGLEFADDAETSTDFGWSNPQGVMQAVPDSAGWYSIGLKIMSDASDGFSIYVNDSNTKLSEYDNQWNNTEDYATLTSGESSEYAIKDGTLYKSFSAANPSEPVAGDEFTLYVYQENQEGEEEVPGLYMNIVNHTGLEFAAGTQTTTEWDWWQEGDEPLGIFQAVQGDEGWYSIGLKVLDAAAEDGIEIYASDNGSAALMNYDNFAGNNPEDYEVLTGKTSTEYAVKDGMLYKSFEIAKNSHTYDELAELVGTVPEDLTGYTAVSQEALQAAAEKADACLTNTDATEAEITDAYKALAEAIAGLRLSAKFYVEPVKGIREDTIRGVDISSYLSIMDAFDILNERARDNGEAETYGFKDFDGNLLDKQGFFALLSAQGVNYVRIRVWNDPYNADKKGYGGGSNDVAKAVEMGEYATQAGMKVLVDFHYSDFWADPGKQQAPKAWANYSVQEKAAAIKEFTSESLQEMLDNGVDVAMVQVGNETNGAMCGVSGTGDWTGDLDILFDAGCDAVHETAANNNTDILAAVHFTNPESSGRQAGYASNLAAYDGDGDGVKEGVSYDVFATSYYPYWHGSLENLNSVLGGIAKTYDKYVMVAETSWANTLDDVDGHENTVRAGSNDTGDNNNWLFTQQGQVLEFRDVLASIVGITNNDGEERGLGAFYWEGAWVGIQNAYKEDGTVDEAVLTENKELWETTGSGWASSFASGYDPEDAGKWYGGSAVDNQSFFGADGTALGSLAAFNYDYLSKGANTEEKEIEGYACSDVAIEIGDTLTADKLGKATLYYNDRTTESVAVEWNQGDIDEVNAQIAKQSGIKEYTVGGKLQNTDIAVEVKIVVNPKSLLTNASFETYVDSAWTGWNCTQTPDKTADNNENDSRTGTGKVHFYNSNNFQFTLKQQVTVNAPGTYGAFVYAQGKDAVVTLKVSAAGKTFAGKATSVTGTWMEWVTPSVADFEVTADMFGSDGKATLTYEISVDGKAGAWGTIDDAYLYAVKAGAPIVVNAAAPTISRQPVSASYTSKASAKALSVAASVSDKGTLTYQWYSNTKNSTANALRLTGATSASYTPSTQTAGTRYYFCRVTNTNNAVNGVKTASRDSSIAAITVTAPTNVKKAANKLTLQKKSYTKQTSSKKQTVSLGAKAKGTITYTSSNSKVKVSKSGKATIPANFVGNAVITVKAGSAKYATVSGKVTITVNPAGVSVKGVTSKKARKASVTWKKNSKVSGYVIQYSTKKNFSTSTTKTVKGASKTKLTLSGLKAGKKYYVRIRTYKTVSGKKYNSGWSKAKPVKVAK